MNVSPFTPEQEERVRELIAEALCSDRNDFAHAIAAGIADGLSDRAKRRPTPHSQRHLLGKSAGQA